MVRSKYKQRTLRFGVFDPVRQEGNGMSGHTWRMVVAGEDLAKDGAARPVVAARKERPREGGKERKTEVKSWSGERKSRPSLIRNRTVEVVFFFLRFLIACHGCAHKQITSNSRAAL